MAWMAWHGCMVAYLHEGRQTLVFGSFRMGQDFFPPVKDRSAPALPLTLHGAPKTPKPLPHTFGMEQEKEELRILRSVDLPPEPHCLAWVSFSSTVAVVQGPE